MKLFAASILFYLGIGGVPHSNEVSQILDRYIQWTQTGQPHLSNLIFDADVDLTYQAREGEFESTPFPEYASKTESAATSVPRSMTVVDFSISGNRATAYVRDVSMDGDFSLVHQLRLKKKKNEWRITAIKIMPDS